MRAIWTALSLALAVRYGERAAEYLWEKLDSEKEIDCPCCDGKGRRKVRKP